MDKTIGPKRNKRRNGTLLFAAIVIVASSIVITMALINKPPAKRSQEPTKPYPYYSENITFENAHAKITLSGTLTLPAKEGSYPAVILITGSGPQNRDEEVAGHKPFLVISDYLTKKGIAVLRYDDRGFGQSTGDFKSGTSFDFSTDVESAVNYLKTRSEINQNKIGLVGHSDGGTIAPMVAAKSRDVAFIVLLAGPGIQGGKLLVMRQELMAKAMGLSDAEAQESIKWNEKTFKIVSRSKDPQTIKVDLTRYVKENPPNIPSRFIPPGMTREQFIAAGIDNLTSPWFIYILNYDPAHTLEKVTCPVLALNGAKDAQVPSQENLTAISVALKKGGNENVTIKELPNLNHFFQECKTCSLMEYATLDQTFSPVALAEISNWVLKQ
jgi:pimeloyl-ACP methyl ester carboxylesterase